MRGDGRIYLLYWLQMLVENIRAKQMKTVFLFRNQPNIKQPIW